MSASVRYDLESISNSIIVTRKSATPFKTCLFWNIDSRTLFKAKQLYNIYKVLKAKVFP